MFPGGKQQGVRLESERFCWAALGGSWVLAKDALSSPVRGEWMTCEHSLFLLTAERISEDALRIHSAGPGSSVEAIQNLRDFFKKRNTAF